MLPLKENPARLPWSKEETEERCQTCWAGCSVSVPMWQCFVACPGKSKRTVGLPGHNDIRSQTLWGKGLECVRCTTLSANHIHGSDQPGAVCNHLSGIWCQRPIFSMLLSMRPYSLRMCAPPKPCSHFRWCEQVRQQSLRPERRLPSGVRIVRGAWKGPVLPGTMGCVIVPTASTAMYAQNARAGTIGGCGAGQERWSPVQEKAGRGEDPVLTHQLDVNLLCQLCLVAWQWIVELCELCDKLISVSQSCYSIVVASILSIEVLSVSQLWNSAGW